MLAQGHLPEAGASYEEAVTAADLDQVEPVKEDHAGLKPLGWQQLMRADVLLGAAQAAAAHHAWEDSEALLSRVCVTEQ